MEAIGAFDAKIRFASLLDRVEKGEEIIITRHGRPVARLVPDTRDFDRAQARAALDRMRDRAQTLGAGAFRWDDMKANRDAGRP